jgi:uncharacterized protein
MNHAKPAWQPVCRAAAQAQAESEARHAWQLPAGAPLPFDNRGEHVAQVHGLALRLGAEVGADLEIVEAAAWLHDVRKAAANHAQAGADAAQTILADTDFPPQKIGAVVYAIRVHAGLYRAPAAPPLTPVEAAVLWDADKLSKLGVLAVAHSLSTASVQGKRLAERWIYVAQFTQEVLARTVTSMNTQPGRRLAARRYREMVTLLQLWASDAREAGVDDPGEFQFEIPFDYDGVSKKQG